MPQFIVLTIESIGWALTSSTATFATGSFLVFNAAAIASGALLIGGLALSSFARSKAKKMRDQYNAAQVDRLVSIKTSIAPRELVMGRVRKGGHVFFRGSVGQYKEKYVMLIALAAHEIDAVEQIYFNDAAVTLDGAGYVQTDPYALSRKENNTLFGTLIAPPEAIPESVFAVTDELGEQSVGYQYLSYTPKARVRWYLGTAGQAAAPDVMTDFPALWTANHRAQGVSYLHCEFWYDETAFPSGLPNVTARIRGAKLYDPRTTLTAWSDNPALMQRHVLVHPQFGKRASLTASENARIMAAANACDTLHDFGDGALALYRAGLVVPFGTAAKDVLDDLAQSMGGSWAYAAGEYYCKAGVYTAPVMPLTEDDLVRSITASDGSTQDVPIVVATHRSRNEKINVMQPRIYDAAQDYKQVALTPLKVASYIFRDGAEFVDEVDLQAVGYAKQAHHICGIMLRDARDPLTIQATFKLKTWPLELFDTVVLTIAFYGWSAKEFEVRSRTYSPLEGVRLTLKETSSAITQPDAEFPVQGFALNSVSPRPWEISPPSIVSITSGTSELIKMSDGTVQSRVRIQWALAPDFSVRNGGQIEVQWQALGSAVQNTLRFSGSETQAFLVPVPDGQTIIIRARSRSQIAVSDWTVQVTHLVLGKTEPPPPFDVFTLLAQPDGTRQFNFAYTSTPKPLDWQGCEIRYSTNLSEANIAAMTRLQDDQTFYTNSPVETNAPIEGSYRFAFMSRDTSGNLSTPSYINIALPKRRTGNVFDEFYEHGDGWLGTLGSFMRLQSESGIGTILEAEDSGTWGSLTTWDAWTRWNRSPASPCAYTAPARDLGTVLAGQVDAKLIAGGTALVELRTGNDGVSWSAWGSIAAPFTARWIQVRCTVTATGGQPVPTLREMSYHVSVDLKREYLNDIVISSLTGIYRINAGDIRIPLANTYTLIKRIGVTIQDNRAGTWSWQRVDGTNAPTPRLQFKLAGTLTDPAFVDFDIEGI